MNKLNFNAKYSHIFLHEKLPTVTTAINITLIWMSSRRKMYFNLLTWMKLVLEWAFDVAGCCTYLLFVLINKLRCFVD